MIIIPKRMTARMQEPFCLFLIGMRINRLLKIQKWLPVFSAMPRIMQELYQHPELGFISGHFSFGEPRSPFNTGNRSRRLPAMQNSLT